MVVSSVHCGVRLYMSGRRVSWTHGTEAITRAATHAQNDNVCSVHMKAEGAYNFCFFLGPGLPRGLGTPSGARVAAPLFAPGFGPGTPFRFPPAAGGARLLDGVLVPLAAAGVSADSAGVSTAGLGAVTWAMGVSDEAVDFDDCVDGSTL